MSRRPSGPPTLRTLAFGELEGGVWGAGLFTGEQGAGVLLLDAGDGGQALAATCEAGAPDGNWRLRTGAGELTVAPAGEAVGTGPLPEVPDGYEQRCTVRGTVVVDGRELTLPAPGRRSQHAAPGELSRFESLRELSAWFEPDEAVSLLALRPRKQRGHEQDAISAAVVDPAGWDAIEDPRLSTTYAAGGRPLRANLELWVADPEQYPRRVGAEAVGRGAQGETGGWSVRAELLRCHSRGADGPGVYLLARAA